MFLKRLTIKGFKSFADATSLEFEPGVTAVVGPNGSGKSNVVDAVTWVLGAQSTRALRSSKMDDVIFVGTASRPALGRAEVALTLDNASGLLPVDGAEVTISRTLFRNQESEYAINGAPCRLLDVQELLSDSGVGRQQHMIIGQGQLDAVLNSRPEDRRSVIEEAAGVLKHRRRKERAERRLAGAQENLERLGDLVREVRRQMRPLERQAVAARSFADVESELRRVRRYALSSRLGSLDTRQRELDELLRRRGHDERELRHQLVVLDAQASSAAAEAASRREEVLASTLGSLQGLGERARGMSGLIDERERSTRAALAASADDNVIASLESDAAKSATDLAALVVDEQSLDARRAELATARSSLGEAEEQFAGTWGGFDPRRGEMELRAASERLEVVARSHESARATWDAASMRWSAARARWEELLSGEDALHHRVTDATAELERAEAARELARAALQSAEDRRDRAERDLAQVTDDLGRAEARAEALTRALAEATGSTSRQTLSEIEGVLGPILDLIEIEDGYERAVEAAVGAAVGAVVVNNAGSAKRALEALRRAGGPGLVLPILDGGSDAAPPVPGATPLRGRVAARGKDRAVEGLLEALLRRCVVAPNFDAAVEAAISHPDAIIVTVEGDRFAPSGWRTAAGAGVVTRAAVEAAESDAARSREERAPRQAERDLARAEVEAAQRAVAEAAARAATCASEVAQAQGDVARHREEKSELDLAVQKLAAESTVAEASLGALSSDLAHATADVAAKERAATDAAGQTKWSEEARATLEAHRAQVDSLASRLERAEAELSERRRLIERRRGEVESRLAGHGEERAAAAQRRESLEADLLALRRLRGVVELAAEDVRRHQDALSEVYREQLENSRASAERLEELRRDRAGLEAQLAELSDAVRREEIEHAEAAVRIANLHEQVRRDLGEEPSAIVGAESPELPDGVGVEERLAELEARIGALGPINPLALEELTALEERYRELDAQVADVRHARRELQEVIRALDEEIMTTFSLAVADVNEHFSTLISMLFPGGQGRLILTEPADPLNTGVEIEVRPMGRNVRRISLLSGGERSMAALAFLFAVFRSRPSPFYMMDEVEAALDDVNLQRFLSLVDEFRHEAQLLIVTHQKRTMEAADALYGVTMAPGGSSKVVSQRVRRDGAAVAS